MPAFTKPARILEFHAENFKRLTVVTIRPDGDLVQITGKNKQGKTSVLDAIWATFEGRDVIQAQPIRKGAAEALIRLDMGEVKLTRKFRRAKEGDDYTTELIAESADGARYNSPQKLLDEVVGALTLDPLHFLRSKPNEQFDTLKSFVVGFDFEDVDRKIEGAERKRTETSRDAQQARAAANSIMVPEGTPEGPIDETALLDEMQAAATHNATIETQKADREADQREIVKKIEDAKRFRENAADLRRRADDFDKLAATCEETAEFTRKQTESLPPVPDPIDISAIRLKVAGAKATNENVAKRATKIEREAKAVELDGVVADFTTTIKAYREAKVAAIKAAKLPIDGLGLGDKIVTLNGLPFDQASDAEQLEVSIALAAAKNPLIRVIRVRDGSLLDDDAMQTLEKFAETNDFQVWIERVDGSGKVGFTLVDGHLAGVAQEPSKP